MKLGVIHSKIVLRRIIILFLFCYAPLTLAQTISAETIYKKYSKAIVMVKTLNNDNIIQSQGSGIILQDKGYVVTNYHILVGSDIIEIYQGSNKLQFIDIVGIDVNRDILIIKIGKTKAPLIKRCSLNKLNVGQKVYAIGNPMGLENTMSEGIISGIRIKNDFGNDLIQVTTPISPGSSGGALFNDKGELVGMTALSLKGAQNLNFAISIDDVMNVPIDAYSKGKSFKEFELFYKGNSAFGNRDLSNAIYYYLEFLKKYPEIPEVYHLIGLAYYFQNDFVSAINYYNEAIKLDKNYVDAYLNRATAKSDVGDRGAINDINTAIEIAPNNSYTYVARGKINISYQKYDEAIKDFNKALTINKNNDKAYNYRGGAKFLLGDSWGAIEDYNRAIELSPSEGSYYFGRAMVKGLMKDRNGLCMDLSKSGELGYLDAYDYIKKLCK